MDWYTVLQLIVIQLIDKLMCKWKTRLEIWNEGEKMTSRWIRVLCGFLQGDSYSPVGSAFLKYQCAYYYKKVEDTEWENQGSG